MFEDMSVFYDIQEYEGVFESMNEYISAQFEFCEYVRAEKKLGRL